MYKIWAVGKLNNFYRADELKVSTINIDCPADSLGDSISLHSAAIKFNSRVTSIVTFVTAEVLVKLINANV